MCQIIASAFRLQPTTLTLVLYTVQIGKYLAVPNSILISFQNPQPWYSKLCKLGQILSKSDFTVVPTIALEATLSLQI